MTANGYDFRSTYLNARPAQTKADVAYRQIRSEIVEGELEPGAQLDQEALAVRLGLSTTPVREALSRLESEELIINRPHRRTVVAPLSFTLLQQTYAVRLALDPLAAALAAEHATDEQRAAIRELVEMEPQSGGAVAYLHHNRLLHRSIYAASGNAVLVQTLDVLWDRSDRYRMATLRDALVIVLANDEHAAIAAAVIGREGQEASDLMAKHVLDSLERIQATELDD